VVINGTFEGMLPGNASSRAVIEADADFETRLRYYRKKVWNPKSFLRFVTFRSNYRMLVRTLVRTIRRRLFGRSSGAPMNTPVAAAASAAGRSPFAGDFRLLAVFSEGSTSLDVVRMAFGKEWESLSRRFPAVSVEVVKDVDHVFTPVRAQEGLVRLVALWLDRLQS
jgi:hypothetical protein